MALCSRLRHALRTISIGAAAVVPAEPASRHSWRACKSGNLKAIQTAWIVEALPISYAQWTISRQQYHSSSLLLERSKTAVESSTDKWDTGHPPVEESQRERGENNTSPDSDRGVASRSSHTLKEGHTPEPQVDVAYTPNLDRPKNTGAILEFNLGQGEKAQKQQEEEIPSPAGKEDPMQKTREGMSPEAAMKSNMIASEDGKLLWCMGVKVNIKCPGDCTNGAYSMLEYTVAPGEGSTTHTHEREDETWYMLDGNLKWQLADKTFDAKEGSFIHLPRGVPHSFANISDKPARMLVSCVPAGFEKYFLEIGIPVDPEDAMKKPTASQEELDTATKAGKNYGISFEPAGHSQTTSSGRQSSTDSKS